YGAGICDHSCRYQRRWHRSLAGWCNPALLMQCKVFPADDSVSVKKRGAGNPVCIPEMEDVVEGLVYGNEPLDYRVHYRVR
ncbi:hypothetical protein, partial [Escherichia coli]